MTFEDLQGLMCLQVPWAQVEAPVWPLPPHWAQRAAPPAAPPPGAGALPVGGLLGVVCSGTAEGASSVSSVTGALLLAPPPPLELLPAVQTLGPGMV